MCLAMQDYATHMYRSRMLKVSKVFMSMQELLSVCTHTCIASIAPISGISQYSVFTYLYWLHTHIFNVLSSVGHFPLSLPLYENVHGKVTHLGLFCSC